MASNPTMEAFERALAHKISKQTEIPQPAPSDTDGSPARLPESPQADLIRFSSPLRQTPKPAQQQPSKPQPFVFAGSKPAVAPLQYAPFGVGMTERMFVLATNPQPRPRPWDHVVVGSSNGRRMYKRAGLVSSRVPAKRLTDYATVEHELFAAQMCPRKRVRISWKQPQLGANQSLFHMRALRRASPDTAARDIKTALDGITQYYGWLAANNLEYPLDVRNHTWTGSLEFEIMTILPRKRYSNREFKIRLEERIYGEVHGGAPDAKAVPARQIARSRHRRTAAKCPDLSIIIECDEPLSSPVRPRATSSRLESSPKPLLVAQVESTPTRSLFPRKALSPFEFSFSSPSPANTLCATTPTGKMSAVKSAAVWRTPDIFDSTPKAVAPSASPPRSAPALSSAIFDQSAVDSSVLKPRRSSGAFSRGSRRSLTTSRLLAISDLALSPASRRVSFGDSEATSALAQNSIADVTMETAPPLDETAADPTASLPATPSQPASGISEPTIVDDKRDSVAPADAEPDIIAPANAEADLVVPANAEANLVMSASDNNGEAEHIVAAGAEASIHVDLRTNLDIFGSHPDIPTGMTPMSDDDTGEEAASSPEKQSDMDEDVADDDLTSVINHSNINDTISLDLGVSQASPCQTEDVAADEDVDSDREELQRFVNRHRAQAKAVTKPGRRSGSLGLSTSMTGSPISRSETSSDSETLTKRMPLGTKDPNMSPSPTKKRKAANADEELGGGRNLLEAPSLEDHSPPRPKRRRRNLEADSDGVLNPAFQQQTSQGEARELRRSTRASSRRNLVAASLSANSSVMSKVPVRLAGSLVGDGVDSSFGSSLSAARTEERRLAATTRTNTRKNRAGALPAGEVLALKSKQKTPPTDEENGDEAPRAKKRTKTGLTKSVRWDSVLARYQDEEAASSSVDAPVAPHPQLSSPPTDSDSDELADSDAPTAEGSDAETRKSTPVARRTTGRISRLPPPTPVKKTTSTAAGPAPPGISASRVKKPAARTAAAGSTPVVRRSSAQLAASSAKIAASLSPTSAPGAAPTAARKTSIQLVATSAAKKAASSAAVPAARRTRIATPAPKKRAMRA